jgi:hypothetical protein
VVKFSFFFSFGFASEQSVIRYANNSRQFLISMLLTLIQMKYQNSGKSPFNTHATIMSTFVVTTYVYTRALEAIFRVTRAIPNWSYLPIAMLFCDILYAVACSLLVFILFPPIGRFLLFLCALVFIRALHDSYWQIFELLHAFKCRVFSKFQHIFNPLRQASNENSMEQEGNGGISMMV